MEKTSCKIHMNHIAIKMLEYKFARMISIIIPVYNADRTLDDCVQSVINQQYKDIEILLINDGSTDSSGNLCNKWAKRDGRVKVFHKENGGVSSARNMGLEVAQGDYVMMLDSDDQLTPDTCEVLMSYQDKESADCIIFGYIGDRIIAPKRKLLYETLEEFRLDFPKWLNTELIASSCNKFYKKDFIKSKFPVNISFGEDLVFVLSYWKQCKRILFVPDALYKYDTSSLNSLSRSFRKEKIYDIEHYLTMVLDFAGRQSDNSDLYQKYMDDALNYVRELYCSDSISYIEKKQILQQWYLQSYLKKINCKYKGSNFYKSLFFCVHNELWLVPQLFLWTIRRFRKLKNVINA